MALESGFWLADVEGTAARMNAALCQKGLTADLPAHDANLTGRWYYDSQTKLLRRDAASAWESLDLGGHAGDMSYLDLTNRELDDKYRDFISWGGSDGYTIGGDGSYSVDFGGVALELITDNVTDNDAYCYSTDIFRHANTSGKLLAVEFVLWDLGAVTDQTIWLRVADTHSDPPSETTAHFGWKISEGDLYTSNATSLVQTIEDTGIDLSAGPQLTRLKAVLNPGTDIKYYVNGELENTVTTRLPDDSSYHLHLHVRTGANLQKQFTIGRVLMECDN